MKKQLTYKIIAAFILFAAPFLVKSEELPIPFSDEASKVIVKEYSINDDGTIEVNNKYGKVHVHTWDNDKVKFEIKISVDADRDENAEERLQSINVDFSGSDSHREAITKYGPDNENDSWWKSWWGGKKKNVKVQVDYTIHVPQSVRLDITNKYGNIYVPNMDNDADINLKYGNVTMEDLKGELHLHLAYGKANVGNLGSLNMDLSYGSFDAIGVNDASIHSKYSKSIISNANNLSWDSKYDDINVSKARSFTNEGKYDNIKIGSVSFVSVDTKYTAINADEIKESFDFDTGYGSITIQNVGKNFDNGTILSKYTNINIENSTNLSYTLEVEYIDPKLSPGFVKEISQKEKNLRNITGYIGNKNGGKILISSKYGSIKIF